MTRPWWTQWNPTLDVIIPTSLVLWMYLRGVREYRHKQAYKSGWKIMSFLVGLALVLLALASPLDAFAEHSFAIHEVQHLALHALAPMLLMLAIPAGPLLRGSPKALRNYVFKPLASNQAVTVLFRLVGSPTGATMSFVGSLYFWQWPPYHDAALLNETIHYGMHVSMLLAGLLFFWRIFDPRPPPIGARYGTRMVMLWVAACVNIPLSAYLSLKQALLYPAYETAGRVQGYAAMVDESVGGLIMWIPGSMMFVVAALIVLGSWGRHESRLAAWRRRGLPQRQRAALGMDNGPIQRKRMVAVANRNLALRFTMIALLVFAAVMLVGWLTRLT